MAPNLLRESVKVPGTQRRAWANSPAAAAPASTAGCWSRFMATKRMIPSRYATWARKFSPSRRCSAVWSRSKMHVWNTPDPFHPFSFGERRANSEPVAEQIWAHAVMKGADLVSEVDSMGHHFRDLHHLPHLPPPQLLLVADRE